MDNSSFMRFFPSLRKICPTPSLPVNANS
jgi:hypothetical protein